MLPLSSEVSVPRSVMTEKIVCLGQSGGGKTYAAMRLAELMLSVEGQIVVLDLAGVWWGLRSSSDGKRAGYPVVVFGGEHGDLPISVAGAAAIADLVVDRDVSVVLDVLELRQEDQVAFADAFLTRLFERKKRARSPLHLFLEECQEIIPETPDSKGSAHLRSTAIRLMKIGRNYGIGWTAITQEPQAASKRGLNQAGTIIAVRTVGAHERKAVADWARSRAKSRADLDLVEILPELEKPQALLWSPAFLKHAGVVHITPKTTFDSSKTPEVGQSARRPKVLAPVELEQLKTAMAEEVARAEREDPAVLHRRVAQLERELAHRPAPIAKVETKTREVPVVREKDLKRIEAAAEKVLAGQAAMADAVKRIADILENARALTIRSAPPVLPAVKGPPVPSRRAARRTEEPRSAAGGKLPRGEHALLIAVAQHVGGVTREQLTVLSGYKRSSRDTYVQRLRERGLVEPNGERLVVTVAGMDLLGTDFSPLPTGAALLDHWRGRLSTGEAALLDVLVGAYPEAVDRERLSEVTKYQRSSRDTYLQRLRARQLITETGRGVFRASDLLFNAAAA